jgi:hypothetical protein
MPQYITFNRLETTPTERGEIFLDGVKVANYMRLPNDAMHGEHANKYYFNRHGLAFELEIPVAPSFKTLVGMLIWLRTFLIEKKGMDVRIKI